MNHPTETGRTALPGIDHQITLNDRDLYCIILAFEAISGSAAGDLIPDAPRLTAANPDWWATALELCEKFDAVQLRDHIGNGPVDLTDELRDLIIRGSKAGEGPRP
jgi:hypothetical protein